MNPHTSMRLHDIRSAELRAEAASYVSYRQVARERQLRPRLGRALVEIGLRLANETAAPGRQVRTA